MGENENSSKNLENETTEKKKDKSKHNDSKNDSKTKKRGSLLNSKVFLREDSNSSNTNKNNNEISKKNSNNLNNFHNTFKLGANKNFPTFNYSLGLGKDKIDTNYWNKDSKKRSGKRQKTVKLSGMKFIDSKLNIIVNYAYSINDFFSNGNFNMNRLKPLNFSDLKRNLKDTNVVYKQLSEKEKKEYNLEKKKN